MERNWNDLNAFGIEDIMVSPHRIAKALAILNDKEAPRQTLVILLDALNDYGVLASQDKGNEAAFVDALYALLWHVERTVFLSAAYCLHECTDEAPLAIRNRVPAPRLHLFDVVMARWEIEDDDPEPDRCPEIG